jgi:hypothetical protein
MNLTGDLMHDGAFFVFSALVRDRERSATVPRQGVTAVRSAERSLDCLGFSPMYNALQAIATGRNTSIFRDAIAAHGGVRH